MYFEKGRDFSAVSRDLAVKETEERGCRAKQRKQKGLGAKRPDPDLDLVFSPNDALARGADRRGQASVAPAQRGYKVTAPPLSMTSGARVCV